MEHLLLVGSVVLGLRTATQLFVVIWSLRADARGRRHAVRLIESLRRRL